MLGYLNDEEMKRITEENSVKSDIEVRSSHRNNWLWEVYLFQECRWKNKDVFS